MKIDTTKIVPEGARVLIEPFVSEEETSNGVIVANNESKSAPVFGTIIKAGNKSKYKEGQSVFFARYSADLLEIDNEDGKTKIYIVVDEEILATMQVDKLQKTNRSAISEKRALKK